MTAEPEAVEATGETHDGVPPDTGGSQVADDGSAVGDVVEETAEGTDGSRADDAEVEEAGKGASPDAERMRELEAQVADARELFAEVRAAARSDPRVAKALGFDVPEGAAEDEGAVAAKGWRADVEAAITGRDEPDPSERPSIATQKILRGLVTPLLREIENLKREQGRTGSTVQKVVQSTASQEFRRELVAAKVPVGTAQYDKVVKGLRRDVPGFSAAEARGDAMALRLIKSEFSAHAGRGALARDEGARIEAAKGGRTGRPAGGNPTMAERVLKFTDGFDPHRHARLLEEADKAGRPRPTIKYEK